MMKKLITTLLVLILVPVVFAGVTNPLPSELELLKGESGRFKFQVQNMNRPAPIECLLELEGSSDLDISFDVNKVLVPANSKTELRGTVKAPDMLGSFNQNFCVKCMPADQESGASVSIDSCGLPINVKVVNKRSRENMVVDFEKHNSWLLPLIIVAAIVLIYLFLVSPKLACKNKKQNNSANKLYKKKVAKKSSKKRKAKSKKK